MGPSSRKPLAVAVTVAALAGRPAPAAAGAPLDFGDAGTKLAFEESTAVLEPPSANDYLAFRAAAFRADIPAWFEQAGRPATPGDAIPSPPDGEPWHSVTDLGASAGAAKRFEAAAFHGLERKGMDAAFTVTDSSARSGDATFENNLFRAEAEAALSDSTGTVFGFAGDYENAASSATTPGDGPAISGVGDRAASSGGLNCFFRSNLWGKAKFGSLVGGTQTDGEYNGAKAGATDIAADLSYDFFWLGYKKSRGMLAVTQENYRVAGGENGYFTAKAALEMDFPIRDRLYLSGGGAAVVYRYAAPQYYFYPSGRLLLRLGGGWGCFLSYRPSFSFPLFRDLYLHRTYVTPGPYRPAEDATFALRSGVNYDYRDKVRITGAVYENRLRQTYAVRDESFGTAVYYNPGRSRVRGTEISLRVLVPPIEHYVRASYAAPRCLDAGAGHFAYYPAYTGAAAVTVHIRTVHALTGEVIYVGARYGRPDADATLAAAWVPRADVYVAIMRGVGITAAAENLTDARYVEPGGVPAPARSVRAGAEVTF